MPSLASHMRTPYVGFLVLSTGAAFGLAAFFGQHFLRRDPNITLFSSGERRGAGFQHMVMSQDQNIKLHAVNAFKQPDGSVKPSFKTGF